MTESWGPAAILSAAALVGAAAGAVWRMVTWHNNLVSRMEAIASDAKHQHELQASQLESVQNELTEFKQESKRNFTKVFERIDDLAERVARLEGKV